MTLRANRPGRDDTDIANLMVICGVRSIDAAEELYEDVSSGEVLPDRAVRMVTRIIEVGLPPTPVRPSAPEIG
ncbi:hypothetical protein [Agromyces sp. GXS1127]|uniref:hypothetical protein n=1 Tax=Agromyces sp. GXS1127 TaxID=3424181 RepID=UPI003D318AEA